jgi:hypothetical protein
LVVQDGWIGLVWFFQDLVLFSLDNFFGNSFGRWILKLYSYLLLLHKDAPDNCAAGQNSFTHSLSPTNGRKSPFYLIISCGNTSASWQDNQKNNLLFKLHPTKNALFWQGIFLILNLFFLVG